MSGAPAEGERLGVLGGGQLGLMLARAAAGLGATPRCLDPNPDACAGAAAELITGPFEAGPHLDRFCDGIDALTYEFENVPAALLGAIEARTGRAINPPARILAAAQDRAAERRLFAEIPPPRWREVDDAGDIPMALEFVGGAGILKSRRFGYDGKGQARVADATDSARVWHAIGERPAVLDELVRFEREVSIIAARAADGSTALYPLNENTHDDGILRRTITPARETDATRAAGDAVLRFMGRTGYVGVLAVEFFERESGGSTELLFNELAPRVHNSGHWTIEGAKTSQFENHARAILGLPLGPAEPAGHAAMLNIVGAPPDAEQTRRIERTGGAALHLYGKAAKPGRKLGHVTVIAPTEAERDELAERLSADCPFVKRR
ncbi:MAG: 5-(carboxyamino)imidazole ribonucleotide synthase [Planctomycetota bacterium]